MRRRSEGVVHQLRVYWITGGAWLKTSTAIRRRCVGDAPRFRKECRTEELRAGFGLGARVIPHALTWGFVWHGLMLLLKSESLESSTAGMNGRCVAPSFVLYVFGTLVMIFMLLYYNYEDCRQCSTLSRILEGIMN